MSRDLGERDVLEWALSSFDPWDPRLNHKNIWQIYRGLRDQGSAVRSGAHDDFWVVTRYDDVKAAASNHAVFASGYGVAIGSITDDASVSVRRIPIATDPPDHAKYRSAMIAPFQARRIVRFEELVRKHVEKLVARAGGKRTIDVVRDIAEPLSVSVISDIIGFNPEARARNRELALALIQARFEEAPAARRAYDEFLAREAERALVEPSGGMLGELAAQTGPGKKFTKADLAAMLHGLALAGHHTTINGISSMLLIAADPSIRSRWLPDPLDGLAIRRFVEESLRLDPPIHLEGRRTTEAVRVGEVEIPAHAQVALLYASANHDERMFTDPELFDPSRQSPHLSFGHGIHSCLGMALSRMEMSAVLSTFVQRFPAHRLAADPVDSGMVYGHHMGWESITVSLS